MGFSGGSQAGCLNNMQGSTSTAETGGGQSHTHNLSANYVGSSTSILQPYLVLIYIIKT